MLLLSLTVISSCSVRVSVLCFLRVAVKYFSTNPRVPLFPHLTADYCAL